MLIRIFAGLSTWVVALLVATSCRAQEQPEQLRTQILRGAYGQHRANNDLVHYHLDIRIDPAKTWLGGKNTIRFRMLQDDDRIQIDLYENLSVDKIVWNDCELSYERELNAVFVDFPERLKSGQEHAIEFHYSGVPQTTGRFGGIKFDKDPTGRPWVYTACEGEGSSIWWPSKDQWRDEPDSMDISIAVPSDLMDVSNGRWMGQTDLGDGFTRWDWRVHYPINSYNVSVNIGRYEHFADKLGELTLDYYVQPEDVDKAKAQFEQVKPMLEAYQRFFGEYPFPKDGYKLVQVPYSGMEHQSAVTYGNKFQNGYLGRDWTGVGVSPKFDFIIIHESGHEWFGNAVSAADVSDMWIHEGWTTYLEVLYVEHVFGSADALKYVNGYKAKVQNRRPIITERGIHREPPQDQYFKGALFLHTLRGVMNDDAKWFALIRETYDTFKYKNIFTEDIVQLFNQRFGRDLTPVFNQYLRQAKLPKLQLAFDSAGRLAAHRWVADEAGFSMPIRIGQPATWQTIESTAKWSETSSDLNKGELAVDTEHFFVDVEMVDWPAAGRQ
jgi:aminopeptidase N